MILLASSTHPTSNVSAWTFQFRDVEDKVSLYDLKKIRLHCTNIRQLTTASERTNVMVWLDLFGCPTILSPGLALVAACFGTLSSLEKVVVEIYDDGPGSDIRSEMEIHGWILKVIVSSKQPVLGRQELHTERDTTFGRI